MVLYYQSNSSEPMEHEMYSAASVTLKYGLLALCVNIISYGDFTHWTRT